jgi:uncharacterized protein YdaU (DUF1376 family)
MSKEYWFPWSPARFRADTMHLTAEQDGIYRRLIDHYMETGLPLPDNDAALARIAGISSDSWVMAAAMLRPFFKAADGKLFLKRCDETLADQTARSRKNAEKGKAGASKRWKSSVDIPEENSSGHASDIAEQSPVESTVQDKTGQDRSKTDSAVPESRAAAVIASFDSAIVEVFGSENGRFCPASTDYVFAERFLACGADEVWLKAYFLERMSKRKRDGKGPIGELSYLKDAVPEAHANFLAAKSSPVKRPGVPQQEQTILRTSSVEEKKRANELLQRFQSGGRA